MEQFSAATSGPRPLRVFLSSTARDLGAYRESVAKVIEGLGHAQLRMETFGARPGHSLAECQQLARQADALVVVVGRRYGWVPLPEEGGDGRKSITWHEVEAATTAAVPVFRYLGEPAFPDGTDDDERLQEFRQFLRKFIVAEFASPEDLATKVSISLGEWARDRARDFKAALQMIELTQNGEPPTAFEVARLPRRALLLKVVYSVAMRPEELPPLVDGRHMAAATTILAQQEQHYKQQKAGLDWELTAARTKAENIRKQVDGIENEPRPTEPRPPYSPPDNTGLGFIPAPNFTTEAEKLAIARAREEARKRYSESLQRYTVALAQYEGRQRGLAEKQQLLLAADQHVSQISFNLDQIGNLWAAARQQLEEDVLLAREQDISVLLQDMCTQSTQLVSNPGTLTQGVLLLLATDFSCSYLSEHLAGHVPAMMRVAQVKKDVEEVAEEVVRQHHQLIGQDCLALLLPLTESRTFEWKVLHQLRATIAGLPPEAISTFCSEAEQQLAAEIPSAEVDRSLIDPAAIALAQAAIARKMDEVAASIWQGEALCRKNAALRAQVQAARQEADLRLDELKAHAAVGQAHLSNGELAWAIVAKATQTPDLGPDTKAFCASLQAEAKRRFQEPAQALISHYAAQDFGIPEAQTIIAEQFPSAFLTLMQALAGRVETLKKLVPKLQEALGIITDLPLQQVQRFKQWLSPIVLLILLPGIGLLCVAYASVLMQQYKPAFPSNHTAYQGLGGWVFPRLAWAAGISTALTICSALARPIVERRLAAEYSDPALISYLLIAGYGLSGAILVYLVYSVSRVKKKHE